MPPMKGFFKCQHPEKYKGDPTQIIYRSQWEFKVMMQLDHDPQVVEWASEENPIAYTSPVDAYTGRVHRYFPDFFVKKRDGTTYIIEVKPAEQCLPPKKPKKSDTAKRQKQFLKESMTYAVNQAKWQAAEKYCARKGWNFIVITEKEIFGKNTWL